MPATLPSVLVDTEWVAQHATDAGVRVIEVDVDTTAYDHGHVPGAVGWNWNTELCDTVVRDIVRASRDRPFRVAWEEVTGTSLDRAESAWRRTSLIRYRWLPIVTASSTFWHSGVPAANSMPA